MAPAIEAVPFAAIAVFALFRVAQGTVEAELAEKAPPVGWLRWLIYAAAGLLLGRSVADLVLLLAPYAGVQPARETLKLWVMVGWSGGIVFHGLAAARLRSHAGPPRRDLFAPPGAGKWSDPPLETLLPSDIQNALRRLYGLEALNPVFWSGVILLATALAGRHEVIAAWRWPLGAAGVATGIAGLWFWNRLIVPRWRVWALEHVEDIDLLEAAAINSWLLLSPHRALGRWMSRSEFWTPALRRRALASGKGRGGPVWRGAA